MPSVKVYTRPTCAPCLTLKRWLQSKGVTYIEINVDEDPRLIEEVILKSGYQQFPMTLVGDTPISGLNLALLSKTLML